MSHLPLRVGLVGASARAGWAKISHVPALKSLSDVKLEAVATRSIESARAAAEAFGAKLSFSDYRELVTNSGVDVVAVSVKVPDHLAIVNAALAAGKHVLSEWPLGRNLAEAEEMAKNGLRAGVRTAVGLQGRAHPAVRRASQLVRDGAIGRPLTASIYSPTFALGPVMPASLAYFEDPANGATLTTIAAGHTLDIAICVLGGLAELSALPTVTNKDIQLIDPPGRATRVSADHLLIQGHHVDGCALGVEIAGNQPPGSQFKFRIVGAKGEIILTGDHPIGPQASDFKLEGSIPFDAPEANVAADLEGPAINVAESYAAFGRDIRTGERTTPDFDHAVRMHRLIDAIYTSGETGVRQSAKDWPNN
jgi:predicted dehydrogenase